MLESVLFVLLLIVTVSTLAAGLLKRGGYLHVPFLFAAVYAGWVIPQLWSLQVRQVAPGESLSTLLLMSLLCLVATIIGWRLGMGAQKNPLRRILPHVRDRDVTRAAIVLTGIALIAFVNLGFTPGAEQESSLWTGTDTILYFVLNLKSVSFVMSLLLFLKRRTTVSIALLAINLMMFAPYTIILFKRRQIAELFLIAAYAMLVVRNWAIPRAVVVAGFVVASFATFAAAEVRSITDDGSLPTLDELSQIDFVALSPINDPKASPEITNAAHLVDAVELSERYTLGGQMWNRIVFQYVPGQFVGYQTKANLMATPWPEEIMYETTRYDTPTGTTMTGIATAYLEYGYLGFMFFFISSYIMAHLWRHGFHGNSWDKIWYAAGMVPSFIAITAHSAYFFVAFFLFFVALGVTSLILRASFGGQPALSTNASHSTATHLSGAGQTTRGN